MNTTTISDGLAALGRDAPDERALASLVGSATGLPGAVPTSARIEPVDYEIGTPSTEALLRVLGTAELPSGESVEWSVFLKKLQSTRHWPMMHLVPEELREAFIQNLPWQLEIAVHRSTIATLLPDGLRLPQLYRINEYDDDRATLWMEDVIQPPGGWPLGRFERAAYLLGQLSARRQPHLVEPLLPRGNVDVPGTGLRYYTGGRVMNGAIPVLADDQTWQHPLLAEAVCSTGDHGLRDELLELANRLPAVLDRLDTLPQTYQHGDASPQNLLVPKDKQDEFVVIDWGFDCPQAVGFDLGQLLVGLAHAGELAAEELPTIHTVILGAFMEGLAAEGMTVSEDEVLYGYLGSLLARATFTALPLEQLGKTSDCNLDLFVERVRLTRTLVNLVSSIS
ncbi:phosphotransferase [Streptomyces sp. SID13031]|uniref:phosphotransferase n=1 Tax=Streptomyces sp. SID13031 TaxID=2706046 RepID=UPI0013C8C880|nr:phosphotransferase [Streptomyces sp. SID13031]NEA32091.1 phosphotransferase [Streptomyces sp. SID13031]